MPSIAVGLLCFFFVGGTYLSGSIFNWFHRYPSDSDLPIPVTHTHTTPIQHSSSSSRSHHDSRTQSAEADRVSNLPGLSDGTEPPFEQFAGYLDVSESRHVFYWYVESQGNPSTDPLILWTNGGPGCSGLIGFGTEHGPFFIGPNGDLDPNPYSWNTLANMLYIEIPAGVGFSYVDQEEDLHTDDAQNARDNYHLILQFFERYPERKSNDFYIASESYGGHYIPQLALEILRHDHYGAISFRGFLVGNPYVDPYSNMVTQFESFYAHGLLAKPLFDNWSRYCKGDTPLKSRTSSHCDTLVSHMFRAFGKGINPYALDYPVCTESFEMNPSEEMIHPFSLSASQRLSSIISDNTRSPLRTASSQVQALLNRTDIYSNPPFLPAQDHYKPCSQVHLERYLNNPQVRAALHVNESALKLRNSDAQNWDLCGGVLYSTGDINTPTTALFQELVDRGLEGDHCLRMMVFSGDDDSVCSTAGTQAWIWDLGVEPTIIWQPWKVNHQTAGFVSTFRLGSSANDTTGSDDVDDDATTTTAASLIFVTVHGAGHEVPAYRPMEALSLLQQFLKASW